MNDVNVQNRFSQIYKSNTNLYSDSPRFRVRFFTYLKNSLDNFRLVNKIQETLGVKINTYFGLLKQVCWNIEEFISTAPIRDILGLVQTMVPPNLL